MTTYSPSDVYCNGENQANAHRPWVQRICQANNCAVNCAERCEDLAQIRNNLNRRQSLWSFTFTACCCSRWCFRSLSMLFGVCLLPIHMYKFFVHWRRRGSIRLHVPCHPRLDLHQYGIFYPTWSSSSTRKCGKMFGWRILSSGNMVANANVNVFKRTDTL